MTSVIIVAIIFGSLLTFAALVCGTILTIVKTRRSGLSGDSRAAQNEEAKMMQEIYHSLSKMEQRIDALETILMERQHK